MSVTGVDLPSLAGRRRGQGSLGTALGSIVVGPLSAALLAWMMWRVLRGIAPAFDFRFAYCVLLLMPLALLRSRLSWVWLLPILMWVCPPAYPVHRWQAIVYWIVIVMMFADPLGVLFPAFRAWPHTIAAVGT